ncbi:MAG: glycosyltransferase family 4 protein [Anaerolineae bacterium]
MRVCYFGTYRVEYSRNQIMIEGLRRNGVEVVECHETLWQSIEDRVNVASGGWKQFAFMTRLLKAYLRLLRRYRQVGDYDVLVVGYPGQLDVFLARLLAWLRRKPLVWDVFMSIYLIAWERGLGERGRLNLWLLRVLEYLACRLPDRLIQDTDEYVAWLCRTHHLKAERFRLVPTGADDRNFYPVAATKSGGRFRVVYYGTYIRNHGVPYMLEAARRLQSMPEIRFEFIGQGPMRAEVEALARKYALTNVQFTDWVESAELPAYLADADVCLGAFGDTPQSLMTIQNKVYEGLAMGKPVISGDSPTVRATFTHGEHLYLCPRGDPQALANAILMLYRDPVLTRRLAEAGKQRFQEEFTVQCTGAMFRKHLEEIVLRKTSFER